MNQVKVSLSVFPECKFSQRPRIISRLESHLRILLEHIFDLSSPCVDWCF